LSKLFSTNLLVITLLLLKAFFAAAVNLPSAAAYSPVFLPSSVEALALSL
jgi:hypothetical protein